MQNLRSVPLTIFEIEGLKLNKKKKKKKKKKKQKNWRKWTFCHISHVSGPIQTNFYIHIHIDIGYHRLVLKSGLLLKVKVQIRILECRGIMGQDLVHPYIQSTTVLCDTILL